MFVDDVEVDATTVVLGAGSDHLFLATVVSSTETQLSTSYVQDRERHVAAASLIVRLDLPAVPSSEILDDCELDEAGGRRRCLLHHIAAVTGVVSDAGVMPRVEVSDDALAAIEHWS